MVDYVITGITPKADNLPIAENAENRNLNDKAETKTQDAETPSLSSSSPPPPPDGNSNAVLQAVTNLNAHLTTLHAALPPRTAFLLFSGHSDPRSMSRLAARRAEYQASQNQRQGNQSNSEAATGTGGDTVRWSTADDRALEEAVAHARMGLLFVGVKT